MNRLPVVVAVAVIVIVIAGAAIFFGPSAMHSASSSTASLSSQSQSSTSSVTPTMASSSTLSSSSATPTTSSAGSAAVTTVAVSATPTQSIIASAFTLNPAGSKIYQFTVPSSAASSELRGSYSASGGITTKVDVSVLDSAAYASYQNGATYKPIYDSGELQTATWDVKLPSTGSYYIIFFNFDTFGRATVSTSVDLILA